MTHSKKPRLVSAILAFCMMFAGCAQSELPAPTPSPAEEVVGIPSPSPSTAPVATPSFAPSPSPAPAFEPDFPAGPADGVLPAADTPRFLKNGFAFTCPHEAKETCETCLSEGALPLPDESRLAAILRFLTSQSRLTGSEHCAQSAAFLQKALSECGYEPIVQPVSTENTGYVLSGESALAFGETVLPMEYVYGSAQGVKTGRAVFCGSGHPLPESAEGAVLIANDATVLSVIQALGLGTPAAVVLTEKDASSAQILPTLWPEAIVLATDDADLANLVKEGEILTVSSANNGPFESENVIAVAHADKAETIILCAHYDSVPTTPGANDNAAGAALLLELARVFSQIPTEFRVVFLFTTGEEQGMLGSWVYSRSLSAKERASVRAVYALDMFADGNQGLPLLYTCDGEPNAAVASVLAACAGYGLPRPALGKESRSDHAPFDGLDLPAALIAQSESDELYHTPYDTMDKLSAAYMDLVFAWAAGALLH